MKLNFGIQTYKEELASLLAIPSFDEVVAMLRKLQKRRPKSSGYQGVCWQRTRWKVQLRALKQPLFEGNFDNEEHAARAFDGALFYVEGSEAKTTFKDYTPGELRHIEQLRDNDKHHLKAD